MNQKATEAGGKPEKQTSTEDELFLAQGNTNIVKQ